MYLSFVFDVMQRKVKPLHPGSIVVDILEDRGVSQEEFCNSDFKLLEILLGEKVISFHYAWYIEQKLSISHKLLLNLQRKADIWDSLLE